MREEAQCTFVPGAGRDLALHEDVEVDAQRELSVVLVPLHEGILGPSQVPQHHRHVTVRMAHDTHDARHTTHAVVSVSRGEGTQHKRTAVWDSY